MSPGPSNRENQGQTFLATLQNILAVLEDEVSPLIPENTYLTLASQIQILYNIHNNSGCGSGSVSYTYDGSGNYFTRVGRLSGIVSNSNSNNIISSNVTNFNNVMPVLITMYDAMSYSQRQRAYENNNYTNLMNTARSFWNAMSIAEKRDCLTNMGQPEIEFGGPIHRIIYPRS
jgi:hypothetical protein